MSKGTKGRRRPAPRAAPGGDLRRRAAGIVLALGAVFALQLATCRGRLALPFVDTRLHYHYDNALFTFLARNGLRNGDLRSQFGVTLNRHSRWAQRRGTPSYYTDHPFLGRTLFQQYARFAGTGERASRTFSLGISFAVAAGLFVVLLQTTANLPAALAGACTLVSLPVFATYQTCVKFETDGMLASVWLFAALVSFLRGGSRRALWLYGILVAVAILTHWTAALFGAAVAVGLILRARTGHDPNAAQALRATAAGGFAGAALLLGVMSFLQGGLAPAWAVLGRAFSTRSAAVPAADWWSRQGDYARQNFGVLFPWLATALAVFIAVRWLRKRRAPAPDGLAAAGLLPFFTLATLAVAALWLVAFRQGSFVHIYWQLWFCLPVGALVAAALTALPRGFGRVAGIAGSALLVFSLQSQARAAYEGIERDQLGQAEDVAFLASLREDRFDRFLFVPVTDAPLNAWFQGPLFEYYTDRAVEIAAAGTDLRSGDKLLVLRYAPRQDVADRLAAWSGKRLLNEKCGLRLCAYDVADP
jgi:hypothetical protein